MSEHIPQVSGQLTEGDEGLPEFWQKEFATSKEVAAAMKLLGITSIQTCPKCRQMWINLNDEKCRKCGASMVHVAENKPAATEHGTGSGEAKDWFESMPSLSDVPTPPASQPTVTLDRATFDKLCNELEMEASAAEISFNYPAAARLNKLLVIIRAAERK